MNQDNEYTTFCSRCGAEMKSNSRYCMKCGNLNYEHDKNETMKPYMKGKKQGYHIHKGKFFGAKSDSTNKGPIDVVVSDKIGKPLLPFLFIYVIYVIVILYSMISTYRGGADDLYLFAESAYPFISIVISVLAILLYSNALLFMKCNKPWWASLIPIYNLMVLAEIVFENSLLGLILLIPGVNIVFALILFYRLGIQFRFNGILTAIFPYIMVPVIGFVGRSHNGVAFISKEKRAVERNYRRKKIFLITTLAILVIGIAMFTYSIVKTKINHVSFSFLGNYYYVSTSKRLVNKVKRNVVAQNISCSSFDFVEGSGVYYFYYADVSDAIFMPFNVFLKPLSAYVKLDYSSGTAQYYVSITDEKRGFGETLVDNVSLKTVIDYPALLFDYSPTSLCHFG